MIRGERKSKLLEVISRKLDIEENELQIAARKYSKTTEKKMCCLFLFLKTEVHYIA